MTYSEKAEAFLRDHLNRQKELSNKAIHSFGAMGKLNLKQIFKMSNAKVHPDNQLSVEVVDDVLDHVDETGEKDVVNGC